MESATSAAAQARKSDARLCVAPVAHRHRQSHRQDLRSAHHPRHHPRRRPPPDQGRARRFRHDELRSGLQQHRLLQQQGHYIDGDNGILRYRGYPSRSSPSRAPISKPPTCSSTASCPRASSWRTGPTTSPTTPSSTRASRISRRLPLRRPSHGHADLHDRRALHLLSRRQGHLRRRDPARSRRSV